MLGRDLESVYEHCGRRFSLKSMIFIALQLIKRFETIHSVGIIYRDVKPGCILQTSKQSLILYPFSAENFMIGSKTNLVYVIDYGLSKPFQDEQGRHVSPGLTNELIGTSRYMSVNAHMCKEQSRRDDLEAIGYVFSYFLRGRLPWSGLRAASFSEHNKLICEMKRTVVEDELLDGHPPEFIYYLKYVRSLDFEAIPNYDKLRNMFKRVFHVNKLKDDGVYDWNR